MKAMNRIFIPLVLVALFLASNSLFIIKQWEMAVRFQFGEIIEVHKTPGIHLKVPFIQNVRIFDGRIQTLETKPERFLTLEKKNLIVDTFVKWRVTDPQIYYQRVQGNPALLNSLLDPIIKNSYRAEFGRKTLQEVVAGYENKTKQTTREEIQNSILEVVKLEGEKAGVEIIDVRMKGVELPSDVTESVFSRMKTERERAAREFRAKGESYYIEKIANADKQRAVMLAEAYGKAEVIRGKGDATAADVYAKAYGKDGEFYEFQRSLKAYQASIKNSGDMLILDMDSQFFKYFQPK